MGKKVSGVNVMEYVRGPINYYSPKMRSLTPENFSMERIESNFGYKSGYSPIADPVRNLKRLEGELKILRWYFPELAMADFNRSFVTSLSDKIERWILVPRWHKIAPTYIGAVNRVHETISQARDGKFRNVCKNQKKKGEENPYILDENFYLLANTNSYLRHIGYEQRGFGILAVPVQLGYNFRGYSCRYSIQAMDTLEVGMDPFTAGIAILENKKRLLQYEDLWLNCTGGVFQTKADGLFFPCYRVAPFGGAVEYTTYPANHACYARGAGTMFYLPSKTGEVSSSLVNPITTTQLATDRIAS
jgi:hypothetical protein